MERITIIGMSPVGTSLGLALKRSNLINTEIIGSSGDREALSRARKMGAVDKTVNTLGKAIEGAQLVILDTPLTESLELLEAISPELDKGCVVTDLGTIKVPLIEWANQNLPSEVDFVGGHPLSKHKPRNHEEADYALFEGIEYCVIPAKSTEQNSVERVVDMIETLGAKPLFMDPHEHDSYAVAMAHLPIVLSSAYVTTMARSVSWREMHRLAAAEFDNISLLSSNDPQENEAACLAHPDQLVHWLDQIISELYVYRDQIKDRSSKLIQPFVDAWEARARWEAGIVAPEDESKPPSVGGSLAGAFLGGRLADRYHQIAENDKKKKDSWIYPKKS